MLLLLDRFFALLLRKDMLLTRGLTPRVNPVCDLFLFIQEGEQAVEVGSG